MKNLIFTFFAAFLMTSLASAQGSFTIVPIPSYVTAPPQTFDTAATAIIKNVSNVRDSFHWERIVMQMPGNDFRTAVCDPTQCYFDNVSSESFALEAGEEGELDVHFYNYTEESASGLIRVKVTNIKNPADSLSGLYYYNSTSGTRDPLPAANVQLFPNPFTEGFTLDHADDVAAVRVFSLNGREVAFFNPSANQRYSLADQVAGTYIIALISRDGQVFQAMEVRKQ